MTTNLFLLVRRLERKESKDMDLWERVLLILNTVYGLKIWFAEQGVIVY